MTRLPVALFLAATACLADTYPRQPAIRPIHYAFHITLDDSTDRIVGEAEVEIRFVQPANEFWLDLGKGMTVSAVESNGPVEYAHVPDRLTLHLAKAAAEGELRRFTIRYQGVAKAGLHIGPNRYGERTIFSDNWPTRAHEWLPVIDHPSAKATSEFFVTAAARYQVISNGRLIEETDLGDGRRLTHWRQGIPIAPWLNALGVAQFSSRHFGSVAGIPLETWVYHQDRDAAISGFEAPIREAIEFYVDHVGPFPYEKMGNVEAAGMQGGMELASAIFYGEKAFDGKPQRDLIAHEIAHQWFGDSVTESDWDDVWLSEGFATYFTHLTALHYRGREAFVAGLKRDRETVFTAEKKEPGLAVIHQNLSDMNHVLNRLVYQKAGWVLHMLHCKIGEDAFWSGIRTYYARYRDRNATTADFRHVMEESSRMDLAAFFDQWLRRAGSPEITAIWRYDAGAGALKLEVEQKDAFTMPLEIGIEDAKGTRVETVQVTQAHQTFQVRCAATPTRVTLDPETKLLAQFHISSQN